MANEITIQSMLTLAKGSNKASFAPDTQRVTQTGSRMKDIVKSVTTSEVTIAINDIGTPGYLCIQNLDGTNFVKWGISTGVYTGRLNAGEVANPFRIEPGVTTLYLIADTASCDVRVFALEN